MGRAKGAVVCNEVTHDLVGIILPHCYTTQFHHDIIVDRLVGKVKGRIVRGEFTHNLANLAAAYRTVVTHYSTARLCRIITPSCYTAFYF